MDFLPKTNFEHIILHFNNGVTTINNPKTLNALTIVSNNELIQAFTYASLTENSRVIILTGAGNDFSSGGDLNQVMLSPNDPQKTKR